MNSRQLCKTLRIDLYHIASTSPAHERKQDMHVNHGVVTMRPAPHLSSEWRTKEHEFLWAIYSRAVYDYFGIGLSGRQYDAADIPAGDTAIHGMIELPSGEKRNILWHLGIDPECAWASIQKAINYTKMKEAA
ncbi:MAG TPA: hypothetical protein VM621_10485 [Luteibacter sp.]|uniref:hypothetical protein n=1 Tax=Luteibacter sp. TaxID=1886636 RepID=UPI002C5A1A6E|nr:hypothetical protein [Luteibacter sp.]HVI55466.1 hypothetical protein [Luteibacter sp.]